MRWSFLFLWYVTAYENHRQNHDPYLEDRSLEEFGDGKAKREGSECKGNDVYGEESSAADDDAKPSEPRALIPKNDQENADRREGEVDVCDHCMDQGVIEREDADKNKRDASEKETG